MSNVVKKELPENWAWTTMDNISDVVGGGTPKSKEKRFYQNGSIPWLTPADLSGYKEKYVSNGARFITEDGLNSSSAKIMPAGTVLFTSRAPIGYVVIAKNEICTNQGFKSFVIKSDKILPDYVYWWLKGSKQLAESFASGTTFLELSGSKAKQLPIPIAPLEQQKRIVAKIEELFSHIDAGIEALNKVKQLLKQYRQSVLKAAVTGELTKEWREQNKISLDEWEQTTIGEIALVQTGKTPKRSNQEFWEGGTIPWLTSSATNNDFTNEADQFVTQAAVDSGLKLFGSGTLLLAMYGEGKTRGQVTEITFQATCNQACAAIIVDQEKASNSYVRLRLYENYEETRKAASGGNQPNLNLTKVRDITLPLPGMVEQSEIVGQVEAKFDAIGRLANELDIQLLKAEKNKQSVLASAFSGVLN